MLFLSSWLILSSPSCFEMHLEGLNVSGCRPTFLLPSVSPLSVPLKWRFWSRLSASPHRGHFSQPCSFQAPVSRHRLTARTVRGNHERLLTSLNSGFGTHSRLSNSWDGNRPGPNICLLLRALVSSIFANAIIKELSIFYKYY